MRKVLVHLVVLVLLHSNSFANTGCQCVKPLADVVAPLLPAVVNVSVTEKRTTRGHIKGLFKEEFPFEEFFERFGIPGHELEEKSEDMLSVSAAGSGFIIDPTGYIVTNHHVIADSEKISVKLSNGSELEAELVGSDSRTDLALLRVKAKEALPFVKFANSDIVRVGDSVVTIGNPFGLGGTVTSGIISATSRDINSGTLVDNFIQTDASVNQGNSGGPLFNSSGEVIGINTAIVSPTGGNIGIAFAIPSSFASPIIEQIKNGGRVKRGWLGIVMQPTSKFAESMGIDEDTGTMVISIFKNSPADKAGIKVGDIILEFDGKKITNEQKLPRLVAETPVGKKINILLLTNGQKKTVTLALSEMDEKAESIIAKDLKKDNGYVSKKLLGMHLVEIDDSVKSKLRIGDNVSGLYIYEVGSKSSAKKEGLKKGDVITAINQQPVINLTDFESVLDRALKAGRKSVMLTINRKGNLFPLQLKIEEKND
jgi:serine protease Do